MNDIQTRQYKKGLSFRIGKRRNVKKSESKMTHGRRAFSGRFEGSQSSSLETSTCKSNQSEVSYSRMVETIRCQNSSTLSSGWVFRHGENKPSRIGSVKPFNKFWSLPPLSISPRFHPESTNENKTSHNGEHWAGPPEGWRMACVSLRYEAGHLHMCWLN